MLELFPILELFSIYFTQVNKDNYDDKMICTDGNTTLFDIFAIFETRSMDI